MEKVVTMVRLRRGGRRRRGPGRGPPRHLQQRGVVARYPAGRARIRAECARALEELRRRGDVEFLLAPALPPPARAPAGAGRAGGSPARASPAKRRACDLAAAAAAVAADCERAAKRRALAQMAASSRRRCWAFS